MKQILLLIAAMAAYGQPEYRASQKNPDTAQTFEILNDGTNITANCKANSLQNTSLPISVASATNAAAAVLTVSAGHGFSLKYKPLIIVSGGTGNWTAINGTLVATPINSTTFSIPVNSTAFGALTGTITFTTRAARITEPIWSVNVFTWSGSIPTGSFWYGGSPGALTTCTAIPAQYQ